MRQAHSELGYRDMLVSVAEICDSGPTALGRSLNSMSLCCGLWSLLPQAEGSCVPEVEPLEAKLGAFSLSDSWQAAVWGFHLPGERSKGLRASRGEIWGTSQQVAGGTVPFTTAKCEASAYNTFQNCL